MKTTKKEIRKALRTLNRTIIFKMAKKCGIDVSNKKNVFEFICENCTTQKVRKKAFSIAYCPGKNIYYTTPFNNTLLAISHAKKERKNGKSNYSKILIEGNKNIYWASPIYLHNDYNKSVAFPNNEKNKKIATIINNYLNY